MHVMFVIVAADERQITRGGNVVSGRGRFGRDMGRSDDFWDELKKSQGNDHGGRYEVHFFGVLMEGKESRVGVAVFFWLRDVRDEM